MENNILKSEVLRVANFVYSASKEELLNSHLSSICARFDIDLKQIINENMKR